MIIAGKKEAAANPKANATVAATKSGGLMPKYPAIHTATTADNLAIISSPLSDIVGLSCFLIRSCEMEVDITKSKPAAVDRAAASPPAATRAITQFGRLAISGFAKTVMSGSTFNSFSSGSPTY